MQLDAMTSDSEIARTDKIQMPGPGRCSLTPMTSGLTLKETGYETGRSSVRDAMSE